MDNIIFTGDFHVGSKSSIFLKHAKMLKEKWDGKPIILMGDLVDSGIDRGMQFDNDLNPQDQIDEVANFFDGLNVIGYVNGNHEERFFKATGLQPFKTVFKMEPTNYIRFKGKYFYISHGISAAQNAFLEHEKFLRYIPKTDVLALGHSHELAKRSVLRGGRHMYLARTGSFLAGARYTTNAGMAPKIPGWIEYDVTRSHMELLGIVNGRVKRL